MPSNEPHDIIAVDPDMHLTVENYLERTLPEKFTWQVPSKKRFTFCLFYTSLSF